MSRRRRQDGDEKDEETVWEGTVRGRAVRLTRSAVTKALRGIVPSRILKHAVEIEGTWYPVTQAFAVASGMDRIEATTVQSWTIFQRLGFRLSSRPHPAMWEDAQGRPLLKPGMELISMVPSFEEWLEIGRVVLEWCWWKWWTDIRDGYPGGAQVLVPTTPGVYNVSIYPGHECIYIGKANDLRARVKFGLVKAASSHPPARKMVENEDLSQLIVRWACTDRPAAAEEELHQDHVKRHGALPKYVERT